MTIKTIVAAIALEHPDDPVLPRALQLARQHDARLVLVHVVAHGSVLREVEGSTGPVIEDARQTIDAMIKEQGGFENSETIVLAGVPYERVTKVATEKKADVVLIGVGKPSNLKEKILGSTADRIVRLANLPILIVRRPLVGDGYQKIVAAVDFSPAASNALDVALRLAPAARFELLHIVDIPLGLEQAMRKTGTSQQEITNYRRAKGRTARKKLRELRKLDPRLMNAEPRIAYGNALAALVRRSRREEVGLLVLGTHGQNDLSRLLLGSVTRHALGRAGSDVLVAGS